MLNECGEDGESECCIYGAIVLSNVEIFVCSNIQQLSQAKVGAIVEKKQGTAKTYFNTSDMR